MRVRSSLFTLVSAFVLLSAWLYHAGYPLAEQGMRLRVYQEQQQRMRQGLGSYCTLVLTLHEYKQGIRNNEKEFYRGGDWYEVVRKTIRDGRVHCLLLRDGRETRLDRSVRQHQDAQKKALARKYTAFFWFLHHLRWDTPKPNFLSTAGKQYGQRMDSLSKGYIQRRLRPPPARF